jgi:NADPH2:quinone reductase
MKSIRVHAFGGPDVLKLEDLPDPRPAAGQVVVQPRAIGVNPSETYARSGKFGPIPFPFTPGTDAAGVVQAIGAGVTQMKVGDRVYIYGSVSGAYASLILCNAAQVYPLPERLSFQQGAGIGVPFGTAYRAMFIRGKAKPAQSVLVHGASGGVGTAAVQLGRNAGLIVVGTAGTEEGLQLVRQEGARHALNHHDKDYLQQLMSLTGGRGVELILEMLANVNLGKDLGVLAKGGRVVVIGSRDRVEIDPRQTMSKDTDIRGMSLMNADEAELTRIHAALGAGFENGSLSPVVGQEFPLADAGRAHEAVMRESGAHGKIVLIP